MVGRTMAPERCPHPSPWNPGICYLKIADVVKVAHKLSFRRITQVGPVAKTPHSQCGGPGSNPWSGNWIPQAAAKRSHATRKIKDPSCHS